MARDRLKVTDFDWFWPGRGRSSGPDRPVRIPGKGPGGPPQDGRAMARPGLRSACFPRKTANALAGTGLPGFYRVARAGPDPAGYGPPGLDPAGTDLASRPDGSGQAGLAFWPGWPRRADQPSRAVRAQVGRQPGCTSPAGPPGRRGHRGGAPGLELLVRPAATQRPADGGHDPSLQGLPLAPHPGARAGEQDWGVP
jgi:hypothetical protein